MSVTYGAHETLRLRREDGTWRVVTDVIDWYSQRTPRQAVRSFVRAVEARRWDVLLRLLPEADREAIERWRTHDWPRLQNGRDASARPLSSSTKAERS